MEDTLIKLADLYHLCNDELKRDSDTIGCLFNACEFLNGKFTGDPENLTVRGHYFRKLVDELLTRTNNKLIKKFPCRFNDLFKAINRFIELYELRKTEFEAIDYKTLRSDYPNFETLYLFNYYDLVFSQTNAVFNKFKEARIKIKIKSGKEHLLSISTKANHTKKVKSLPQLPECFIDGNYWNTLMKDPRLQDYYEKIENEKFKWIGKKNLLSGLAFRLMHRQKLKNNITSGQDLAKIFCSYFGTKFDSKDDRMFRPERAMEYSFTWIN